MKELKSSFEEAGYEKVLTYIQSGNIVFTSGEKDPQKLEKELEKIILDKFSFNVPVIIRTANQLKATIKDNPYLKEKNIDEARLYFTLLAESPSTENIKKLKDYQFEPDKFEIASTVVYVFCPNGYGVTKLTNNFFENKLKVNATTRNLNTLTKLIDLADNL
ncbi:hypothetical protein D3C78_1343080 [compost metagenome]